jgi:hypothetical protein
MNTHSVHNLMFVELPGYSKPLVFSVTQHNVPTTQLPLTEAGKRSELTNSTTCSIGY